MDNKPFEGSSLGINFIHFKTAPKNIHFDVNVNILAFYRFKHIFVTIPRT
jgi:hypothetical protein